VSVFSGPSGAGKSTLVNYLLGEEVQVTTEVSEKTSKGMHTTTFSRMFDLPAGGAIIDTPGIREFGISDINPEDLSFYFHDFDEYRGNCRFPNCTHTHEPHCGVKDAVEEELITIERYASYLNIFETLPEGL
jgi:ribosome biogenesis GTPase